MSVKSFVLVLLQLFLMGILFVKGSLLLIDIWLIIHILGVFISFWGVWSIGNGNFNIQPEVKSDFLVQKGCYKWIRNPMYSGILIFFLPVLIREAKIWNWVFYGALIIVFILKASMEERFLAQKFGKQFITYKQNTKRFIPFLY